MTEQDGLLTPEEMGYAVLSIAVKDQWCFRGDTLEDNLPSYQAIAKAQQAKDNQKIEEAKREGEGKVDALLDKFEKYYALGASAQRDVVVHIKEHWQAIK